MADLNSSLSRYPTDLANSAEVRRAKSDSISMAYEFRTKSAQSGALENIGRREGVLGLSSSIAVRRFAREAPCLLGISAVSQVSGEC
jgi:hypothetical protein